MLMNNMCLSTGFYEWSDVTFFPESVLDNKVAWADDLNHKNRLAILVI